MSRKTRDRELVEVKNREIVDWQIKYESEHQKAIDIEAALKKSYNENGNLMFDLEKEKQLFLVFRPKILFINLIKWLRKTLKLLKKSSRKI